ncbi:MAG: homoserine dehydrogenase [Muribaculaceae bacterium]|nr:homoserine dehydrogenase [Muribaculaceae bacterium]
MKELNIGLFGFGTVGTGIYTVLERIRNAHASIKRICVRSLDRERPVSLPEGILTDNPDDILNDPEIDLVVEVIDNADAAFRIVSSALRRGIPVVSGNKAMIARHLPELIYLQRAHGTALLYDASACGSIPVIRNLEEYYDNDLLLEVKGILNGSSNYILSRVFDHGESYADALEKAQRLGFAEADPSFDIKGFDSLFKLVIITIHAIGVYVNPDDVLACGIDSISDFDIRYAREKGAKIKLVAQVVKLDDSRFTLFVMPEFVAPGKYIYCVDDEYNGVVIRGECYDRQFMFGKGAGSLPTASSILSDVTARHHDYRYEYKKMSYDGLPEYTDDVSLRVYMRHPNPELPHGIVFDKVCESYVSDRGCYTVGDISLAALRANKALLDDPEVFICNFPRFFLDLD